MICRSEGRASFFCLVCGSFTVEDMILTGGDNRLLTTNACVSAPAVPSLPSCLALEDLLNLQNSDKEIQDAEQSIKHRADSEGVVCFFCFLQSCVASLGCGRKKNCETQEKVPHLHPTTACYHHPPLTTTTPPSLSSISLPYRPPFSPLLP